MNRGGMRLPKGASGKGPQNVRSTVKRLARYVSAYRLRLVFVVLCILVSAVAGVVSSLFIRTLIDGYIAPLLLQASPDFSGLLRLLVIMAAVYASGVAAGYLYNRAMVTVAQGALKRVRDEMFSHMQTLPIKYFDTHSYGAVMSHYTNDTDTLRMLIAQSFPQVLSSIVSITAVFFAMLSLSVWLTAFTLAYTALIIFLTRRLTGQSRKYFIRQQETLADVNGYVEEMIGGQRVVKVFCHEQKSIEGFERRNEELCQNAAEANKFANMLGPIMNNLGHVLYVLLAVLGAALSLSGAANLSLTGFGAMTLGVIASFMQMSRSFIMPVSQVSQQIASVVMALAGAERIFRLMDEAGEQDDGYVTLVNARRENGELREADGRTGLWAWRHPHADGTVTYTELKGDIVLDDVDFGYSEDKRVLHGVSLYAKPGQKIAFVGATGAGKTTITNLINRFYDIADGKIRYDGININKIRKSDLRRSLGMVLQDVSLFTGTVMENLRYGKLDATDEECISAARRAGADSFIRMLPNGYDTVLTGDGSGLSQGQRQLISIARAAVADPPVMILDEATSSIDTRTEAIVQRGMDELMKGRTVFVIAHRLSTVRNADAIIVLENGRIIERGDHSSLIAERGTYYRLYTGAFELE